MRPLRINDRIRSAQVRVIGDDGAQLGIMTPMDAVKLARERGLDLVEVAPQNDPPVCRIMDFNKFRYDEQRREREARRKHHVTKLKEMKFKPRIEEHDYQVKLAMLKRFLMRGDQAKVTMVYRGREMAHTELGRRIVDRLVNDLSFISKVERTPHMEGRFMTLIIGPDRDKIKKVERQATQEAKRAGASGDAHSDMVPAPAAKSAPTKPAADTPNTT